MVVSDIVPLLLKLPANVIPSFFAILLTWWMADKVARRRDRGALRAVWTMALAHCEVLVMDVFSRRAWEAREGDDRLNAVPALRISFRYRMATVSAALHEAYSSVSDSNSQLRIAALQAGVEEVLDVVLEKAISARTHKEYAYAVEVAGRGAFRAMARSGMVS